MWSLQKWKIKENKPLCHTPKRIHKYPFLTHHPTIRILIRDFIILLTAKCVMDVSCLSAPSLITTLSPSSGHYPQLSLIYFLWSGITQPESSIHHVDDRASGGRLFQGLWKKHLYAKLYFYSCVISRSPLRKSIQGHSLRAWTTDELWLSLWKVKVTLRRGTTAKGDGISSLSLAF